jgi:polar amino acid transport system substrate-binding protein
MTSDLRSIARNGVLRAAINTGNRALVQEEGGSLHGISPDLARRLAHEIGATLEPVVYTGAGAVFADAERDAWDVAFLAVDSIRARKVSFTRPYLTIEATYAIRADGPIAGVEDVDRDGVTVLTSTGSAYELHLSSALRHARLERSGTPGESFGEFREGRGDVVAGVRESLERHFGGDPGFRVLPGVLTKVEQAMVLPGPAHPATAALDEFVSRAMAEGVGAPI